MSAQGGEPPRKKRRSKWDIQPSEVAPTADANHDATPPQAPTSAAAAAAAKLNAKLASEGKLKPASAIYMPASSSVLSPSPNPLASTLLPSPIGASSYCIVGTQGSASSTIDINDLDVREQLTKPATLTDINKTTGVMVAVRGKHLTQDQSSSDTPLHIHIQGPTKEKVDVAVIYINSLIRSLQQVGTKGGGALLSTPPIPPLQPTPPQHSSGPHYVQDKVFVGLEKASEEFKVKERIEGIGGSFLGHIASQTGAKVYLRGRGSGFIEPTSGRESFEAMYIYISHGTQDGLSAARKLCESLIQTVQKDHETWKRSQQPLGFGGQAPPYRAPYSNPYHRGAYPQPPFGPLPPAGGPNFGPPPPGPFPPPPPGYGYYPGPPMPPSQYPPGPTGLYGPPPPGGFGPPPPAEFQQPGPRPPYQPLPPQVPLPSHPPPDHDTKSQPLQQPLEKVDPEAPTSSASAAAAAAPVKRRFTEQAPNSNGLSKTTATDSGPYWSQVAPPRRFTEGPTDDKPTTETKPEPPSSQSAPAEDQCLPEQAPTGQGTDASIREKVDSSEVKNEQENSSDCGAFGKKGGSEETKLVMPLPPGPAPQVFAVPSMPPRSFIPTRTSLPSSANDKPEVTKSPVPPQPSSNSPAPFSSTSPSPPAPQSIQSNTPTLTSHTPSLGPLVAYGDDSDSDVDS